MVCGGDGNEGGSRMQKAGGRQAGAPPSGWLAPPEPGSLCRLRSSQGTSALTAARGRRASLLFWFLVFASLAQCFSPVLFLYSPLRSWPHFKPRKCQTHWPGFSDRPSFFLASATCLKHLSPVSTGGGLRDFQRPAPNASWR